MCELPANVVFRRRIFAGFRRLFNRLERFNAARAGLDATREMVAHLLTKLQRRRKKWLPASLSKPPSAAVKKIGICGQSAVRLPRFDFWSKNNQLVSADPDTVIGN